MYVESIEHDVLMFRGDAFESVATAFIGDDDVLLIDTLASRADAEWMRAHLELTLGKTVRAIIMTHYMSDHMAGLRLFPDVQIFAQRLFMHTYLSQRQRSAEQDEQFVRPGVLIDDALSLQWGPHTLAVFHNPGKTVCALAVDVADYDLLLCGDAIVGNIVYLSSCAPELMSQSLKRLRALQRARVIPGHMGVQRGAALGNAAFYLDTLGRCVREMRERAEPDIAAEQIKAIRIEDCLAENVPARPFEREWHARNLDVIVERRLFAVAGTAERPSNDC